MEYLDKMDLDKGYFVLFELKSTDKVSWEKRMGWKVKGFEGKEITVVEM